MVSSFLATNDVQLDSRVKSTVSKLPLHVEVIPRLPIPEERLLSHGRKLEEITCKDNVESAKGLASPIREDVATAPVDRRELVQPNHRLLVNDEVRHPTKHGLQGPKTLAAQPVVRCSISGDGETEQ
jgi:hypothetical protein